MDYQGVAVVLGAVAAVIVGLGGFTMQLLVFIRQGQDRRLLQVTHDLVNGLSARKDAALEGKALAEGKALGKEEERKQNGK